MIFKNVDREGWNQDIDTYLGDGGYEDLKKALTMSQPDVVNEVKASGLRGRGGAGFPVRGEMGLHQAGQPEAHLPDLQRRRIRAGHVQGPVYHPSGPAPVDRGDDHLLLRGQRAAGLSCTSGASSPKARKFSKRALAEARARLPGQEYPGVGLRLRNLRPPWRGRLHLRRGNGTHRIARRQAPLPAHQAALFSRRCWGCTSVRPSSTTSKRSAT